MRIWLRTFHSIILKYIVFPKTSAKYASFLRKLCCYKTNLLHLFIQKNDNFFLFKHLLKYFGHPNNGTSDRARIWTSGRLKWSLSLKQLRMVTNHVLSGKERKCKNLVAAHLGETKTSYMSTWALRLWSVSYYYFLTNHDAVLVKNIQKFWSLLPAFPSLSPDIFHN